MHHTQTDPWFRTGRDPANTRSGSGTSAAQKTNVTPVFGGGVGIHLGPIAVTAGADVFAYKAGFDGSGQTDEKVNQRDIHLKLGFGMPFGGSLSRPRAAKPKS
jgi:hypothetical protein